jgi:hypothetical protein
MSVPSNSNNPCLRTGALALALGLAVAGTPGSALAEETPAPRHRLSVYMTSGALAYLSNAQTMGGLGAGLGIRDTLDERFILQADVNYLGYIRNAAALRVSAGAQLRGPYAPAALLTLTTLMGERLSFLTPEHPTRITGPAMSLGITLAPVRFVLPDVPEVQVSMLQLGVGVGSDFPGLGLSYSLGLLEVGAAF